MVQHQSSEGVTTGASAKRFDASRYVTKLKGKDYLEVKWRLLWLRTEQPDAVIRTELVAHDREQRWAMFRATVILPSGGEATGYGQEDAKGFAGNPGDYPEKAETKALGRALAALGYGTQFADDHEFSAGDPERVVDSPVASPAKAAPAGATPSPAVSAAPAPAPGGHLVDEAGKLGLPRITGLKHDGKNVLDLDGVHCYAEQTPGGTVYVSIAHCDAHGGAWKAKLKPDGALSKWQHRTASGEICTMARQPAERRHAS